MQRGWSRPVAWLPAVFATIHFAAGFGELVEGLAGWRRNAMNSPSSSEGDPAAVRGRS
jgi:hypothetical protein